MRKQHAAIEIKGICALLVVGGGLLAAGPGIASPAHADLSDVQWANQIGQPVYVPHVDTSVRHSR
jgi:hypothetical protein